MTIVERWLGVGLLALLLGASFVSLRSGAAPKEVIEGRVVAVHDGDSITVRAAAETVKVRLSGIDTPERGQPWARRAHEALAARVAGKEVRVIAITLDRYGRTVGEVYADNLCVGCELVRDGHAWVYRKYSDDPVLLALEAEARKARRGIWSLAEAERVPPWEWRQRPGRARGAVVAEPLASHDEFACGTKRSCAEMQSCAEARFHLAECELPGLDRDRDGVPCDALCGGG